MQTEWAASPPAEPDLIECIASSTSEEDGEPPVCPGLILVLLWSVRDVVRRFKNQVTMRWFLLLRATFHVSGGDLLLIGESGHTPPRLFSAHVVGSRIGSKSSFPSVT